MKITNALGAIAASAMLLGLAIPADAAGLMNVTTTGTTTISGSIKSDTTSWDNYSGVQITASTTQTLNDAVGSSSVKLGGTKISAMQENGQANFAEQANVTFFKGGDYSKTSINGQINQTQTSVSSGIQTSFGN